MVTLRTTGYRSKSLFADFSLGIFDGLDNALWCYAFATVIFAGVMAQFLPLLIVILLCGWAMLGIFVAVTSEKQVHIVSLDEQAVVILASIASLMVVSMGEENVATNGLATMLAVMSLSALGVALFFWVIGHYRLTRLLELMPYPVICGFMAGIGWLLLEAGVGIAVNQPISMGMIEQLKDPDNISKLLLFIVGAIVLLVAVTTIQRAWALPVASLGLVIAFYAAAAFKGFSMQELISQGWLFDIPTDTGGAIGLLQTLSFSQVDTSFVLSVVPQILTIAFLALLTQSMSLSAMMATGSQDLDTSSEIEDMGAGNVLNAMIASPPGSTDVIASTLYEQFGASSRWMAIVSSLVCLVMAVVGSAIIPWMPKLLVGATVFLFAWQLFYEWMYENVRGFQPIDFAIVLMILGTVIFVGFMAGIAVGILLALLLFVLRYSMISAIQGQYSLASYRSSVERSQTSNALLDDHGAECLVYTLRGFLFFGTANAILDTIRDDAHVRTSDYKMILLDLKRVTGMDISALNTFVQIKTLCEMSGVKLFYSSVSLETRDSLLMMDAVSKEDGEPLIFPDADYAVEYMEDVLLTRYDSENGDRSVEDHLLRIFNDPDKVNILMSAMERIEVEEREHLFEQGERDTGLFILDQGSMTALISTEHDGWKRVKKFRPGSLIGEMSAYTSDRLRTASVVANEPSVLYHLTSEKLAQLDTDNLILTASIHELVARTLGNRITYMNRRLFLELK
ncbi:MAG: SulP family inorganic anion transporter [Xanthomonadales bacterium]|jgi:SulP family sulfate permease|nr:SulP family inorganic anion transporter [Xanthomonadales bacterium]MDH4002541.1 SulP family inorganic anion transporter [Xanthomonadales bacterium]